MTLKDLARLAHQSLVGSARCDVRHSHVYELIAAAFGHRSWAAFHSESLVVDTGIGEAPKDSLPQVIGRAVQLQYEQNAARAMAEELLNFAHERQLGALGRTALDESLRPPPRYVDEDGEDDEPEDWTEVASKSGPSWLPSRERLLGSSLLVSSLEQEAASKPERHFLLAALYRCGKPNPYLYEESLKGRVLTSVERGWAEEYLRLEPQYRKYEAHLKQAALGGVRAAALEYGKVFRSPEFFALAERLTGEVDALEMARIASTSQSRASWLRKAAEQGSRSALEALADLGEPWAEERLAQQGDTAWMRGAAERALAHGDALRAWTWHYLALEHGVDLTKSSMAAYHDGGENDGQFYDSDFGGPAYVSGEVGLELPELNRSGHREARAKALEILEKAS